MTTLENALTMIELEQNWDALKYHESVEKDLWKQYEKTENEQELANLEKQLLSNSDKIAYHKNQMKDLFNQIQNENYTYSQMSKFLENEKFTNKLQQAIDNAKDVRNNHLKA